MTYMTFITPMTSNSPAYPQSLPPDRIVPSIPNPAWLLNHQCSVASFRQYSVDNPVYRSFQIREYVFLSPPRFASEKNSWLRGCKKYEQRFFQMKPPSIRSLRGLHQAYTSWAGRYLPLRSSGIFFLPPLRERSLPRNP